ncbi:unnamed protein product, partial [Ectocarpus fasciculatus]
MVTARVFQRPPHPARGPGPQGDEEPARTPTDVQTKSVCGEREGRVNANSARLLSSLQTCRRR